MSREATTLLCPRDGSRLKVQRWQSSEYASCPSCHGLRVERSALESWGRARAVPSTGAKRPAEEMEILEGAALCSCTGQPLMNRVVRHGLSLDVCPSCGAVWFDAGEIERHLEREGGRREREGATGVVHRERYAVERAPEVILDVLGEILTLLW